jgi:hypothetical protein
MYNQSNAITCLKCKVKFIFFSIKLYIYTYKIWTLLKWSNTLGSSSNSILKIGQFSNWVTMAFPRKLGTFNLGTLELDLIT